MYKSSVLILCFSLGIALASNCNDISGFWQNQLGSNMTIILMPENGITGEYSTAVESRLRAALVSSNITGTFTPLNGGALLSFTVLFNHGKSLTTWVGQCMICDGEETLFTSWVLRAHFPKPVDRWMSNNINQDTFKRVRNGANSIPKHLQTLGPSKKDERSLSCEKSLEAGQGYWVSDSGDAIQFASCYESGSFTGLYRDSPLIGRSGGGGYFTALGLVSSSSERVKGWTGYIHEGSVNKQRLLEASWLVHSYSDDCKDPRSFVRFGSESYSHSISKKGTTGKEEESTISKLFHYLLSYIV